MVIQYIGRTTSFKGKPLWEILANLKNFGVGRLVYRNAFQRYDEPCYMRILKVKAEPDVTRNHPDDIRKVIVLVEKVFRGITSPKPIQMDSTTYKADYILVPKDEEYLFLENKRVHVPSKLLPKTMPVPPLFSEVAKLYTKYNKISYKHMNSGELLQIPVSYGTGKKDKYRIAQDNETPIAFSTRLGEPVSPSLYADTKDYVESKETTS